MLTVLASMSRLRRDRLGGVLGSRECVNGPKKRREFVNRRKKWREFVNEGPGVKRELAKIGA